MKIYSIFDDFPLDAVKKLRDNNIEIQLNPKDAPRPSVDELKKILCEYDGIVISTAEKLSNSFFDDINDKKIIATASIGIDHINVPKSKSDIIKVINAPIANRISVAEHTFALILSFRKNLIEARSVAVRNLNKKSMKQKPRDLYGAIIGVIGVGGIGRAVIDMAKIFGMNIIAWTKNPSKHKDLLENGVHFVDLDMLMKTADIVTVNIPSTPQTTNLITASHINSMKKKSMIISTSRPEVTNNVAIFSRALIDDNFCVGMDIDADKVDGMWNSDMKNVIITPHIAGGTDESRKRLFNEICDNLINLK